MNLTEIGETIKEKRKKKRLTQEGLGKIVGVKRSSVYKWEKGICIPDIERIPILCEALEIPTSLFLPPTSREVELQESTNTNKALSLVEAEGEKKAELNTKNTTQESRLICRPKKSSCIFERYKNRLKKLYLSGSVLIRIIHLVAILLLFMLVLALGASGGLATPSVCPAVYILLLVAFASLLGSCTLQYQRMR